MVRVTRIERISIRLQRIAITILAQPTNCFEAGVGLLGQTLVVSANTSQQAPDRTANDMPSNLVDLLSSRRAFATRPCPGLLLVDRVGVKPTATFLQGKSVLRNPAQTYASILPLDDSPRCPSVRRRTRTVISGCLEDQ